MSNSIESFTSYYEGFVEMEIIFEKENEHFGQFSNEVENLLLEAYPQTAAKTLHRYEKDLGIVVNQNKPVDQRRSTIIGKMRGQGKISGSTIRNMAEAYSRGIVTVDVFPSEYKILITFVDTLGVPDNIEDLKASIEEIKPADMILEFKYRYYLYSDLIKTGLTYKQLIDKNITYKQLLNEGV